jgi:hypothetical protein
LRLAELQRARPEKAIAALEHAEELDRAALGPDERRLLAELYEEADVSGPKVLANHVELLTVDPLHTTGLAALGQHFAVSGDHARADALFRVLALVEPEHPLARQFLDTHVVAGTATGELVIDGMLPAMPPDGGVVEALVSVLEGAPALLADHLPRVEVPADARISPLGERPLAQVWGETLKRLGQSKVALAAVDSVAADADDSPDGANDGGWFEIRCQSPPVILASRRAAQSTDEAALRFALGRALHLTRADAVLAVGLRRATLAALASALLSALHPRHGRRKHHTREGDFVARLSQELARKLPMKVSRQIGALFKEREEQPFDSRQWRAWARQCGNRVGLALCGDLPTAVRVVLGRDDVPTGDALRQLAAEHEDLRDLVAFAGSEAYAKARRQLGFDFRRA